MAKVPYQLKTKRGEKVIKIRLNSNHISDLTSDSKYEIDKKKKEIKSSLFSEMFNKPESKLVLKTNNYTCSLCSKMESFLINEGKVFCNTCYNSFVKKDENNVVDSLLSIHSKTVDNFKLDTNIYRKKSPTKNFNRKRPLNTAQEYDFLNEDINVKSNNVSKFEERLKKYNQLNISQDYDYLTEITNYIKNTQSELVNLNNQINIFYAYELEKALRNHFSNLSISIHGLVKSKINDRVDILSYLDENSIGNHISDNLFYEFSKQFIDLSLSKFTSLSSKQIKFLISMNQKKCLISGEELNECNTVYTYLNPFNKNTFNMIKVSKNIAEKYTYNNNLLEGIANLIISGKKIKIPTIIQAYLLVEYNKLVKFLSETRNLTEFNKISREFNLFYKTYIQDLFNEFFPNTKMFSKNKDRVLHLPIIERILNEIKLKAQG